jgi:hypothetical protein
MLHAFRNTLAKVIATILAIIALNVIKTSLEKFIAPGALDETFAMLIHYFIIGACIVVGFTFLSDIIKFFKK